MYKRGIIVNQCIEDYGSGLNYNCKKWNELLDEVMEQKIKTIVVTHKDRFIRFGYDWFEKFCKKFNTTLVVVKCETKINQNVSVKQKSIKTYKKSRT